ncbi:MAG TPA: hypothetical protein VFW65_00205 [Pseudonocardiaceae bacterium]|nr:hypothetical protein [Pseudonocardiaceae bacterium]
MTGLPTPTSGAFRLCRGVVLAVVSGSLAAAAHGFGGGGVPATGVTVLLTLGVAAIGVAMANRQCSLSGVLAVLGAAQLASHVLLSIETMNMPVMYQVDGPVMVGAHAVAALVSAVLLAKADAAVFEIIAALARLLPTVLSAPPVPEALEQPAPGAHPNDRAITVLLRRRSARRGPPLLA